MSDSLVLPPGATVIERTPHRPLQLPQFPYRSLNLEAISKKFGELEVGASFFFNGVIAFYKVSSDTALSTTTGIEYVVNKETPIKEMMFPEVGEVFSDNNEVKTSVISGSTQNETFPFFYYATGREVLIAVLDNNRWKDYNSSYISVVSVVRKTFIL